MKPKLSELDNVVIDCGDNARLKEIVSEYIWSNVAVPTKGQGVYGILKYDTILKLSDKTWETVSDLSAKTTHHINDIEL